MFHVIRTDRLQFGQVLLRSNPQIGQYLNSGCARVLHLGHSSTSEALASDSLSLSFIRRTCSRV